MTVARTVHGSRGVRCHRHTGYRGRRRSPGLVMPRVAVARRPNLVAVRHRSLVHAGLVRRRRVSRRLVSRSVCGFIRSPAVSLGRPLALARRIVTGCPISRIVVVGQSWTGFGRRMAGIVSGCGTW
jgi:hypothetical protein